MMSATTPAGGSAAVDGVTRSNAAARSAILGTSNVIVLRCDTCGLPFGYLQRDGVLRVTSQHHGQRHVNVRALDALVRLIDEVQQEIRDTQRERERGLMAP